MILEHLNYNHLFNASVAIAVTFAILLTILLTKKSQNSERKKSGFLSIGFTFLLMSAMSLLFFPFVVILGNSFYQYAALPIYESKVVDIESKWVTSDRTDSDGSSYKTTTLMHTAIVEFSMPSSSGSETVRVKNSIQSGSAPEMGEIIRVVYKPGMQTANEFSFRSVALQLAGSVMVLMLGYILLLIYRYSSGKSNERLAEIGTKLGFNVILPMVIISFEAMLIYPLWQHFSGQKVIEELWAVILLSFFAITLGLFILGFIVPAVRKVFKRKPAKFKES